MKNVDITFSTDEHQQMPCHSLAHRICVVDHCYGLPSCGAGEYRYLSALPHTCHRFAGNHPYWLDPVSKKRIVQYFEIFVIILCFVYRCWFLFLHRHRDSLFLDFWLPPLRVGWFVFLLILFWPPPFWPLFYGFIVVTVFTIEMEI